MFSGEQTHPDSGSRTLCHGAFYTLRVVAEILGKSAEEIEMTIAGINHFHWVIAMRSGRTQEDLYPLFREKMMAEMLNEQADFLPELK